MIMTLSTCELHVERPMKQDRCFGGISTCKLRAERGPEAASNSVSEPPNPNCVLRGVRRRSGIPIVGLSTRKLRVERGPSAEPGLAGYFIEQLALGGTVAVGERLAPHTRRAQTM